MTVLYHANTPGEDAPIPDSAAVPWTPGLRSLWDRIAAHDFEPGHPLDFTRRLARDKAWPLGFARGAILEYRRFSFLASAGQGPMTPSEEVDEVWHQHLTYTRDYWDLWCGSVLGAPLHHDPTLGGPAEQDRFRQQYAATLKIYEDFFGPPAEIYWPATHFRFGRQPIYRTVDTKGWLLLPHPARLWRTIRGVLNRCR